MYSVTRCLGEWRICRALFEADRKKADGWGGRQNDALTLCNVHILIPGICEYVTLVDKRDFAGVIKDFEMQQFVSVGPKCNHKFLYRKEVEEDDTTEEEKAM